MLLRRILFLFISGFFVLFVYLANEKVKECEGAEDGERVGKGDGVPNAVQTIVVRQNQNARHEEEQLA